MHIYLFPKCHGHSTFRLVYRNSRRWKFREFSKNKEKHKEFHKWAESPEIGRGKTYLYCGLSIKSINILDLVLQRFFCSGVGAEIRKSLNAAKNGYLSLFMKVSCLEYFCFVIINMLEQNMAILLTQWQRKYLNGFWKYKKRSWI